ncbi:hypothetical protein K502DRAFT_367244 [Neoconidiobolus thromboides FSU 785]|nr:hypothetical protein K502DRAFT_367244 [Neoconidiobolus thromboides FSU 785]
MLPLYLFFILLSSLLAKEGTVAPYTLNSVKLPKVVLYNFKLDFEITLSFKTVNVNESIPYHIYQGSTRESSELIGFGNLNANDGDDFVLDSGTSVHKGEYLAHYNIKDIDCINQVNRNIYITISYKDNEIAEVSQIVHGMPGWVTLLPILLLLGIALFSNQALVALIAGVFLSSTFINGFNPLTGFLRMLDYYTIQSLADLDHTKIAMFTFYLSGMIAMIQKSGGAQALADKISSFASNRRRGQLATFLIGLLIFLDDTASIMIVGSNFQPVTDKLQLSREKLAFLVHSTSSPVSSLSPISSWIGFQVGLIALQLNSLNIQEDPFILFLQTIPSRYYPIFMLVLTLITIVFKREFGPMLVAERRAFIDGKVSKEDNNNLIEDKDPLEPKENCPKRWFNAAIPILITIVVTVLSLMLSGYYSLLDKQSKGEQVSFSAADIAGAGDPYGSLLYSSFTGCLTCILLYKIQRIMNVTESVEVLIYGVKDVVETLIILILAWAIGNAFLDLNCAKFLVSALSSSLPKGVVPSIAFLFACVISFTTGTSWGTTTIMFPLVIPLAHETAPGDRLLLLNTISAILAGALFGDQCSPISSTTILTCLTSKVQVRAHVNSQLPYAILVVFSSLVLGYLPLGYNLFPDWAGLLVGIAFMCLVFFLIGEPSDRVIKAGSSYGIVGRFVQRLIPFKRNQESEEEIIDSHDNLDVFIENALPLPSNSNSGTSTPHPKN